MLNSIRVSLKNSLIYGLGNIAVKVIGFLLIPLYTDPKFFSVDDFGIIGLLDISGQVIIAIIASSLPQSLVRWYWDKEHRDNQKGIFFMALTAQIVVCLIFCLLFLPVSTTLSEMIFRSETWSYTLRLLIIGSAFQAVNNIINMLMRIQSRSVLYTATNLSKLGIVLLLTIYFIVFRKMGVSGIYLAQLIGNGLFLVILSGYSYRNCRPYFSFSTYREMSAYGFPMMFASFAGAMLNVIDRYSLNSMSMLKSVAIYTLAYKISSVLKLVFVDSYKLAITPMIVRKIDSPDNKRFYSKVLLYSSYVIMFAIIGLSLFSREAIMLISRSEDLWGSFAIVPVLSLSVFFLNLREVSSSGLYIAKKTKILGVIVAVSGIMNLALNILLIPLWDIAGAAVATLLSQVFYWYACYFFSQKAYFIPYETGKLFMMFICGSTLAFSGMLVNDLGLVPRLFIKTGLLLSFPFILYFLGFYEKAELLAIKGFIVKWSKPGNFGKNLRSLGGINDED